MFKSKRVLICPNIQLTTHSIYIKIIYLFNTGYEKLKDQRVCASQSSVLCGFAAFSKIQDCKRKFQNICIFSINTFQNIERLAPCFL